MRNSMTTISRRKGILEMINENGEIFVGEVGQKFKVSTATIRNDLEKLEEKNLLIRTGGGASKIEGGGINQEISGRHRIHLQEKGRIGNKAAEFVFDSNTIIIHSGSTTAALVKNLPVVQDLTVITNALNIADLLAQKGNINVIMPGGYLRKNSLSLVGPWAERSISNCNVDKAFLGVDGFDIKNGIYTPNLEEARLNEIMIEVSEEVIVLADSSKFSKRSFAFICPTSTIDKIITDAGIKPDDKKRLEDAGIEVIVV